jgi:hypothetical protein
MFSTKFRHKFKKKKKGSFAPLCVPLGLKKPGDFRVSEGHGHPLVHGKKATNSFLRKRWTESQGFCPPLPLFLLLSLPHRAFKASSLSGKCCVACLLVSSTDLSSHHEFSSVLLSTTFSDELPSNGEQQLEEMRASLSRSLPVDFVDLGCRRNTRTYLRARV